MSLDLEKAASEAYITQKRWLSPSELEAEYGFSKSWQAKARMPKSGTNIPFSKIGKFVRYDRLTIDAWMEKNAVMGGE